MYLPEGMEDYMSTPPKMSIIEPAAHSLHGV